MVRIIANPPACPSPIMTEMIGLSIFSRVHAQEGDGLWLLLELSAKVCMFQKMQDYWVGGAVGSHGEPCVIALKKGCCEVFEVSPVPIVYPGHVARGRGKTRQNTMESVQSLVAEDKPCDLIKLSNSQNGAGERGAHFYGENLMVY